MSRGTLRADWPEEHPARKASPVVFTDGELIRRIKRLKREQQERQQGACPKPVDKNDAGA